PTLLAVQPEPDAERRAALDAQPGGDFFTASVVWDMYENYLGRDPEGAPISAVPGLATAEDLIGFPPTIMVNDDVDGLRIPGETFAPTLTEAGVVLNLSLEPATTHGHLDRPEDPGFDETIRRVADWLAAR